MTHQTQSSQSDHQPTPKEVRTVLASGFMGTLLEYYDFMLYATAASLVFGPLFFSSLGPEGALLASFATLAVGYFMRPVGGIVLGHFGDRYGRKPILVITLAMIGVATVCIGLLPDSRDGNLLGPILLVFLRIIQGFAVGGELTGAALMAVEHAAEKKRALAGAVAIAGGPAGAVLATLAVALMAQLSGDAFLDWGWRIPFLLSAVLVIGAFIIRLKVTESPLFQQLATTQQKRRLPFIEVFRKHTGVIVIGVLICTCMFFTQQIMTVYGLALASQSGVGQPNSLYTKAGSALLLILSTLVFAHLSDRFGRGKILGLGAAFGAIMAIPILSLLSNGTLWGFMVALLLGNVIIQGALYGPFAAFIAERLPTQVRFTGTALTYNIASTLGGLAPTIAAALALAFDGATLPLGILWTLLMVSAVIAIKFSPSPLSMTAGQEPEHAARQEAEGVRS